jgi:formylglycine-generating enzyme required for sulfatase activity
MGSPPDEGWRWSDEKRHEVTLSEGFLIGETEVTQAEWASVMESNPGDFSGCDDCPVEEVTWYEAVEYCNALSLLEGLQPAYEIDGIDVTWLSGTDGYRLPTESEWEYACRAGSSTALYSGDLKDGECGIDPNLISIAWYCANDYPRGTKEVARKQPNAWGLYDTSGNVYEWCWDWYAYRYPDGPVCDPTGPKDGLYRVKRGGSWEYNGQYCRSANRSPFPPASFHNSVGFRVARSAP